VHNTRKFVSSKLMTQTCSFDTQYKGYLFCLGGTQPACPFGWWLVLICSERKILLTGEWFVQREKYCRISQMNTTHWLIGKN
jgi:hypothetical protein